MNYQNKKRMEILEGKLTMPSISKLKKVYGKEVCNELQNMFSAIWYQYLIKGQKGTISLPYWAKRVNHPKAMNIALKLLSEANWIVSKSIPGNNWGECHIQESKILEFVTEQELASVRKFHKFDKYLLRTEPEATKNNLVQINGKTKKTGLVREGFRKSGNTIFEFDTDTMFEYRDQVIALVNKSIDKMTERFPQIRDDMANYGNIGKEIVEHYLYNPGQYSAGQNTIDSRGRNISGMLNKIGNPIGFKIMRSLMIIPEPTRQVATMNGLKNKYLFIAELLGYKKGNVAGKINYGRRAYYNRTNITEPALDDLYEAIWIERIYKDIDYILDMNNWKKKAAIGNYRAGSISMTKCAQKIETFTGRKSSVPIEIDMSNSVAGYMGLLLNHKPFLERTNMIGKTINDAWIINGIANRKQAKTTMRVMYGSSMPADKMWTEMGIPYTTKEVIAFERELEIGEFAVADKFKDFIIGNVKPQSEMTVKIGSESFTIECNRFYRIGDTTNKFDFYDSSTKSIRRIHNTTTVKHPDLKQFKRFFVTLLVHNEDSQVMDNTTDAVYNTYEWVLDIHDALILDSEAATYARDVYCSGRNPTEPSLENIHRNRKGILEGYFTSIGIEPAAIRQWNDTVQPLIQPYKGKLSCNRIVLK